MSAVVHPCGTNKLARYFWQARTPLPPHPPPTSVLPAYLSALSVCVPACLPCLPACLPAYLPVCASVYLPAQQQMRATRHLGLRLRDQLLAFASVCALKLDRGQLSPLGHTFENLASLSLSGKVSLDGRLLRELATGLAAGSTAAAAAAGGSSAAGSSGSSSKGLQSLCLDVHFVGVGAEDVSAALQLLPGLKVGLVQGVGKDGGREWAF
jgi:hypothetical protein